MSVKSPSTIVGIFGDRSMADEAVNALHGVGFVREQMCYSVPGGFSSFIEELKNFFKSSGSHESGVANELTTMGLTDEEAHYYAEEYRNGNIILAIQARGRELEALNIMRQYGAYNPRMATSTPQSDYAATGWPHNKPQAQPVVEEHPQYQMDNTPSESAPASQWQQPGTITPESNREAQPSPSEASQFDEQSYMVSQSPDMPGSHVEHQTSQPDVGTSTSAYDQQLQEQYQAIQQQLQQARARLLIAHEREAHLQQASQAYGQQPQVSQQQLQEAQQELQSILAELQEVQARVGQHQ